MAHACVDWAKPVGEFLKINYDARSGWGFRGKKIDGALMEKESMADPQQISLEVVWCETGTAIS